MGTTIRREPVTTSIPAAPDYKFLNITNFGGLEKSSNPFVVSSNTASDCLNVYVDEDNALSTRPRLAAISDLKQRLGVVDSNVIGVYDLHNGLLFHVKTPAKYYEYLDVPKYKLPSGYVLLEYIENDGLQEGINLGVVRKSGATNLYFSGKLTTAKAADEYSSRFLWDFDDYDWTSCAFTLDGYSSHMIGYGGSVRGLVRDNVPIKTRTDDFTIAREYGYYYYNGTKCEPDVTHVIPDNSKLQLTSMLPLVKARLYEFKLSTDKMITVHCVPCKRISDNSVGLYDIARNKFYTNGNYIAGPEDYSSKAYFEVPVTQFTNGIYYKRNSVPPYRYTEVLLPDDYKQTDYVMAVFNDNDDYRSFDIVSGDIPKNKCKVFEQNNIMYVLDGEHYRNIKDFVISDVEGYVPLVTVGKNKRTVTIDDEGNQKYEYDTQGAQYESVNILSDTYRESYFWEENAGSVPKVITNTDKLQNLDYKLLEHSEWTDDKEVLTVTNDYVLLKDSNNTPKIYCAIISSTAQVLEFKQIENLDTVTLTNDYLYAIENDVLFATNTTTGNVFAWRYNINKRNFESISITTNDSLDIVTKGTIVRTKLTKDLGFYIVFYNPIDNPDRTAAYSYRIDGLENDGISLAYFTQYGNTSATYGTIDIEDVWSKKYPTTIGYYFLTMFLVRAVDSNNSIIYGGCVSEAPYFPDVSMNPLYTKEESVSINKESVVIDYINKKFTFIETNTKTNDLVTLKWVVEVDESNTDTNPYKLSATSSSESLLSDLNSIKTITEGSTAYYLLDINNIYITQSFEKLDEYRDIALNIENIFAFVPNDYVIYGDNHQHVLKYVGQSDQPTFEVTRHLNTVKEDVTEILKLRNIFMTSKIATRFDNNTWFAANNYTFYTAYNDLSYIPLSSYNDLGESYEAITGLSIVNDNILAAYKRNRIYIITPVTINDQLTYSYTETKNVIGNDVVNAPILTILTEMPVIVSYDGIYALNQLENVQSSDRITALISSTMNAKWLKESKQDIDNCITINRLYWTYFILPHRQNTASIGEDKDYTKIYILDNRTGSWFYWELPVLVAAAMVKNNKTHFVTEDGLLYALEITDVIDTSNKDKTLYYDDLKVPSVIPWFWTSQILSLNTLNYSKRLVDTTFVLTDTDSSDSYALNYKFKAFRKNKNAETTELTLTNDIEYVESITKRTMIPRFNFLQFTLSNTEDDEQLNNNKLRLVGLGLKYVLLGGLY